MIKAHSMGIGDILRSSAAWRSMKDRWPGVELHLLFLSRHAGYPSEDLIRQHHLLTSATFLTIREGAPYDAEVRKVPTLSIWRQVWRLSRQIQPDWVIDFEWAGSRTSVVTAVAALASGAQSLGIGQFPLRGLFYRHVAPSTDEFLKKHGISEPFDYTLRDYVVLDALGIKRGEAAIELMPNHDSLAWVHGQYPRIQGLRRLGLNIGCATFGAQHKRMPLDQLARCVQSLMMKCPLELVLTGAPNEYEINEEFLTAFKKEGGDVTHVSNSAGQTDMVSLTALISTCDLFISTDSGPYHMAVALGKPTLCWLTYAETTSFHGHRWVRCLINPSSIEFNSSILDLIKIGFNRN